MTALSTSEVRAMRLTNLRLSRPGTSAAELADWFGAMQAQDLASGKWSLGVRLPGTAEADIDAAFDRAEVLRTWPMRGTIHIVAPGNARWMLDLTGVRALNGLQARWNYLGLDKSVVEQAAEVLGQALRGVRLTRTECLAALEAAGIDTGGGRSYHLLWYAAQIGVTCIGPNSGSEQTFVRLDEWAPDGRTPDRDEALAMLVHMYFRSHGPTTRADFQGWSGLTATDARNAIAGADLRTARHADQEVYYLDADADEPPAMMLLPGFDEFLLGYKDRSVFLDPEHAAAVVPGGNGMFKATVVQRGQVVGTWQRKKLTRKVRITVIPFGHLTAKTRAAVEAPAWRYADWVGKDLELVFD
jgi:hypothetical protein